MLSLFKNRALKAKTEHYKHNYDVEKKCKFILHERKCYGLYKYLQKCL